MFFQYLTFRPTGLSIFFLCVGLLFSAIALSSVAHDLFRAIKEAAREYRRLRRLRALRRVIQTPFD